MDNERRTKHSLYGRHNGQRCPWDRCTSETFPTETEIKIQTFSRYRARLLYFGHVTYRNGNTKKMKGTINSRSNWATGGMNDCGYDDGSRSTIMGQFSICRLAIQLKHHHRYGVKLFRWFIYAFTRRVKYYAHVNVRIYFYFNKYTIS